MCAKWNKRLPVSPLAPLACSSVSLKLCPIESCVQKKRTQFQERPWCYCGAQLHHKDPLCWCDWLTLQSGMGGGLTLMALLRKQGPEVNPWVKMLRKSLSLVWEGAAQMENVRYKKKKELALSPCFSFLQECAAHAYSTKCTEWRVLPNIVLPNICSKKQLNGRHLQKLEPLQIITDGQQGF